MGYTNGLYHMSTVGVKGLISIEWRRLVERSFSEADVLDGVRTLAKPDVFESRRAGVSGGRSATQPDEPHRIGR